MSFPVSIKAVIFIDNKVILLKNERDEWELPGGRLELGEQPIECIKREVEEELALDISVKDIIDSWLFEVIPGKHVVIVTYYCEVNSGTIKISHEHKELGLFTINELKDIKIPEGYLKSIVNRTKLPV